MKILLIEDNKEISANVKEYLELEDFEVDTCFDGECWLEKAIYKNYDLILLDLMIPVIDGVTVCRKLRQRKDTPVIMITAKDSIDDKVLWLDTGASDYIVKPFDLRELMARINSVMKRNISTNITYELGTISIDLDKRSFLKDNTEVHITQKEFLILEKLISNKWNVVNRSDIIEYIWWESALFDGDNKLDVYISNIRNKLDKHLIVTIKWVWYKIGSES